MLGKKSYEHAHFDEFRRFEYLFRFETLISRKTILMLTFKQSIFEVIVNIRNLNVEKKLCESEPKIWKS